jgi:hypothetical protein
VSDDINENLSNFMRRRSPENRYASFDYCFNYFQDARDKEETAGLGHGDRLELSCLHLGFYLASWGMMRGSGGLHRRSLRELAPVVQTIADESPSSWDLDVPGYSESGIEAVLALSGRIQKSYSVSASPILVSKTMLGVFGCLPAFDRFFQLGFGRAKLNRETLRKINAFYRANKHVLDAIHIPTLDFLTGQDTFRRYTQAKIIDMIFFEEGFRQTGRARLLHLATVGVRVCYTLFLGH